MKMGQLYLNQIEWVINTYREFGQRNNQLVLQVAHPSDLTLLDPPCLRSIDTRIQDEYPAFFCVFSVLGSVEWFSGQPGGHSKLKRIHGRRTGCQRR